MAFLEAGAERLDSEKARLTEELAATRAARVKARRDRADARRRRTERAVDAYRRAATGENITNLLQFTPERQRLVVLVGAADREDKARIERLGEQIRALGRSERNANSALRVNERARAELVSQLDGVRAKVAAGSAGITLVGSVKPADVGPTEIARRARAAQLAMQNAALAGAQATSAGADAVAAPDDASAATNAADAKAEADAAANDYAVKRRALAEAVGASVKTDAAKFDEVWAATPVAALKAMYFALSQVGKPYIYATDGPTTYDCSGLTRRAWMENGIALPHFSGAQLRTGIPVAVADLRPGDNLTYGPDGSEHVVMYIGAGFDVEAKGRAYGVVVEEADTASARYAGASRPMA